MGTVFLAERADEQFRQQVAIKLIRGFATEDAARQLRHERQILAELVHPGIARLLDGGETAQGQPYLVMEYVPGEPVTLACQRLQLPIARRIELLREVARAVHHAHQRLVVHRDIKPANVLLREDGRPVLLDFGIAKLVDPESGTLQATQPWFTPAYASPEQRRGEALSTATDVYALGLLLSELLTDVAPVADAEGAVSAPSQGAPRARRGALRGDLDRIVLRATAPDPERRYPSAEALADDLQRHLSGRPVLAVPDSLRYRTGKMLQRHPYGAIAALVAVALLAASGWRLADERDRALRAEARAVDQTKAAEAVTGFLTDLFREAVPGVAADRSLTPEELIDRGRERLQRADVAVAERSRLASVLGEIYTYLGKPDKAAAMHTIAVAAAREAQVGPLELSLRLRHLGLAVSDRGERAASTAAYGEALELARASRDPGAVAQSLTALASDYTRSDRLAEAEVMLREAVTLSTRVFGADAIDTAKAQSYLAEALAFSGRRDEARPVMEQAIATLRRRLPADDFQLLRALSRYGVILLGQRDTVAAERVLLELVAQRSRLLDQDSAMLANAHQGLGAVYYEQGRVPEAETHTRAALEVAERALSTDDPELATYRNGYAIMLIERGDYAPAEPLMRAALQARERKAAGKESLGVVMYRQNLGRLLLLAGKADEAHEMLALPIGEGENTGWALNRALQRLSLAYWEVRFGDPAAALPLLDEAEARVVELGGRDSWRYATLLRYRGLAPAALERRDEARQSLSDALALLRGKRGKDYVGCGEIALDLAELEHRSGAAKAARAWLDEAHRVLDPVLVAHAPQRIRLAALVAAP